MSQIKRVVFVSGKIFYELYHARAARKIRDVTFVRLEQIAPFPFDRMAAAAALYPKAQLVWAQVILSRPWIQVVWGLWFRIQVVWGLGFRIQVVWGLGFRIQVVWVAEIVPYVVGRCMRYNSVQFRYKTSESGIS